MYPNYFMLPILTPFIPEYNDKPVTLYAILQSLVNYGKEDKTKIRNLAKEGRSQIFDFVYPLSNYVNKEEFETNILNHFLKRRIGFQTVTDFKIHLEVKLNEIMPMYNKMFDVLESWKITESEKTTHELSSNRVVDTTTENKINRTNKTTDETTNETTTELNNESSNTTNVTEDRRNSQLPQSEIQNVQNASYLTDYTYNQNETTSNDESSSNGSSNSSINSEQNTTDKTTENGSNNTNDDNTIHEETTKINPTLIFEYIEKMKNIYTMIYKDLDCLFYQLI